MPLKRINTEKWEASPTRRWDFGTYKYHPLWDGPPDADMVVKPGNPPLWRGTSSTQLTQEGLKPNFNKPGAGYEEFNPARIYLSEGKEDAEGYGCIDADVTGGEPLICSVEVDEELFKKLKPGYDGLGEWYIESKSIPRRLVKCSRIPSKTCRDF